MVAVHTGFGWESSGAGQQVALNEGVVGRRAHDFECSWRENGQVGKEQRELMFPQDGNVLAGLSGALWGRLNEGLDGTEEMAPRRWLPVRQASSCGTEDGGTTPINAEARGGTC